jgi:protein arginine N-methyltransferase 1
MIADRVRMDPYAAALRQSITPNSIVLDVGTGTGIFALLSCKFGARRVYAIETDDAIEVAREIAKANSFQDRIEFIQARSTEVTLPERANLMISDMRGVLPFYQQNIPAVIDARARLLDPAAVMIPLRDAIWAAIVEAPEPRRRLDQWDELFGLNQQAAKNLVCNTWWRARVSPEQILSLPQCLATLEYTAVDGPDLSSSVKFSATRPGIAHGVLVWFDTELAKGIGFSNGPEAPEISYGSAFFPWTEPVDLERDDVISLMLSADLVSEDYVWRWQTRIERGSLPGNVIANFAQSTFLGSPLSSTQLHKRAATYRAARNEAGEVDMFVLSLMNGTRATAEIATELLNRFPNKFANFKDALNHAADLAAKYS